MDPYGQYYAQGYPQQNAYQYPPNNAPGYPPQQQQAYYPPVDYSQQGYQQQQYPQTGYPQQGGYGYADPYAYNPNMYTPFVPAPCTGRKKAVFVGINYMSSARPLKGCVNDVKNIKAFLIKIFSVLYPFTDAAGIKWLVEGAMPGDSLFFHFSGHGGQVKDLDGDEDDGFDETILPVDYATAGQIIDDDLNRMLVQPLHAGVRATFLFDSCHSGTAVDLPFTYDAYGNCTDHPGSHGGKAGKKDKKSKGDKKQKGNKAGKADKAGKKAKKSKKSKSNAIAAYANSNGADVVMFSGCRDDQTSADTYVQGLGATGAMSYAFVNCLSRQPKQSYQELLGNMRATLNSGQRTYSQVPQLSSNHPMDMRQQFIM